MVSYFQEPFDDVISDIEPLLQRHWEEIALNKDVVSFVPDYDQYKRLEDRGVLRIFTARNDGALVGYAIYFVSPNAHYSKDLWGVSDIIWVAPEHRHSLVGHFLLRFVEEQLTLEGVSVMSTMTKIGHPALAVLLEKLDHRPVETIYSKLLKGK